MFIIKISTLVNCFLSVVAVLGIISGIYYIVEKFRKYLDLLDIIVSTCIGLLMISIGTLILLRNFGVVSFAF